MRGVLPATWLRQHAIAEETLVDAAGDAEIVAFGDATHGTHELYEARLRWIPLFVARGYRTLVLEASYAQLVAIDAWLQSGEGDPATLLRNPSYFFWNTDEVLELLLWARAQNASGLTPPIRIAGADATEPAAAAQIVINAVHDDAIAATYTCVLSRRTAGESACRAEVAAIRPKLEALQVNAEVLHAARVVEQGQEVLATNLAARDQMLAENVDWLAQRDRRLLVWGHDVHWGRGANAGAILSADHSYFAIGSILGNGTFIAAEPSGSQWVLRPQTMSPASSDDYALLFGDADELLVPLANAPSWLAGPHHLRIAASSIASAESATFDVVDDLTKQFDVLLYVPESTPSRVR